MKAHTLLREYVDMLVDSETTSLVVKGNGGIGKSHSIMDELNKLELKENINYLYITGHMTPLQLYLTINRASTLEAPRLLVFDDIDALVTNKVSIALLKSALWEVRGKRIVSYKSSNSRVEDMPSINFEGKVLLILNDLKQENAFGKPLLDRCIVYDMTLSQKELIEYVDTIIEDIPCGLDTDTKKDVWGQIRRFSDNQRFSVRSVVRAFEFYQYNKDKWRPLFVNSLKLSDEQKIGYEMEEATEADKVKEYTRRTGKSRASYYRSKKTNIRQ